MTMEQWVVYDHPTDYPDEYIARRWEITKDGIKATDDVIASRELKYVRAHILRVMPGAVRLQRASDDDPKIVEVWL